MNKAIKAALLSALVFPGVGHFYLKKSASGAILFGAALGSIYYLVSRSIELARQITEKIQTGEIQPDIIEITELVSKQLSGTETQTQSIATAVLVISWLVAIVDSYRVGYTQKKSGLDNETYNTD